MDAAQDPKPEMQSSTVLDIVQDPKGDMVIKVGGGADAQKIRVHKFALRIASPVFRVMLGPSFSESTRALNEDDPLVLEEDHAEAFTTMCRILHHQPVHTAIAQALIVEMAVISDKYDCAAIVMQHVTTRKYVSTIGWSGFDAVTPSPSGLGNLLCVAYLAEDHYLLWKTSQYVLTHTSAAVLQHDVRLDNIVPAELLDSISALRKSETVDIFECVMKAATTALLPGTGPGPGSKPLCPRAREIIGTFCLELPFASTTEMVALSQKKSLLQICILFKDLGKNAYDEGGACTYYHQGYPVNCQNCSSWATRLDLNGVIQKAVKQKRDAIPGLCLACYKAHGHFVRSDCEHDEGGQPGDS
ncbi:uncharacterized protein AB675_2961 [Cyphellophora attinorum]|uniref:BTB domain-containing protein n=1 Tax=Cyphellophora attinorum TaxID=1664694 RepID=A0A0N0NJD3_9EURO|nr:uncharacterized protein AB675_2961 [Phialophora attinorum]KPI36489.1 hypothetical protein AB675_2961 [Phialophora attinorum]